MREGEYAAEHRSFAADGGDCVGLGGPMLQDFWGNGL